MKIDLDEEDRRLLSDEIYQLLKADLQKWLDSYKEKLLLFATARVMKEVEPILEIKAANLLDKKEKIFFKKLEKDILEALSTLLDEDLKGAIKKQRRSKYGNVTTKKK